MNKIYIICILCLLLSCVKTPTKPEVSSGFSEMNFINIQENHEKPSKVQYLFSLRDEENHAISFTKEELENVQITVLEDGLPIDATESTPILHTSDNFHIDVIFVLDFTASIHEVNGVDEMLLGLEAVLGTLGESHRVAIIEFHDSNPASNFSLIQPFTTDKVGAFNAVQMFVDDPIYAGFSTAWDAVNLGLEQFTETIEENTVRALVVLSDGNDNSSVTAPADLTATAVLKEVQMYNIVLGSPTLDTVSLLTDMADQTGGQFYQTSSVDYLVTQFNKVIADLGGNYKLSYITPKIAAFQSSINLTYKGVTSTEPLTGTIPADIIFDDNRKGLISYTEPSISQGNLEFYITADYVPRDITEFRFRTSTVNPTTISIVSPDDGGILVDWTDPVMGADGFFESEGPALAFGEYGLMFRVVIQLITDMGLTTPITFDNSIYPTDVYFYGGDETELLSSNQWYYELQFGTVVANPTPYAFQENVTNDITFEWTIENLPDSTSVQYNFYLDYAVDVPATLMNESPIDSLSFKTIFSLQDTTDYCWRINYLLQNPSDNEATTIRGPVWKFRTE